MDDLDIIKEKVRILDLCRYAGLQVSKNGFTCCIFHQEKTPSLSIRAKENYFKCFGCGESGSVIDFYMKLYNKELPEAIKDLKQLAGLDNSGLSSLPGLMNTGASYHQSKPALNFEKVKECISEDELYLFDERTGSGMEESKSLEYIRLQRIEKNSEIFFEFYYYCLTKFRDQKFFNYLVNERKLSEKAIEKFDLFFVGNYHQASNHLKKKFDLGDLKRSGLFSDEGNLVFYKHRIVIPCKYKNKITYLKARFFDENYSPETDSSKYLGLRNDALNVNTPKRFFNIDIIKTMFNGETLHITEGFFDTMIMDDLGFKSIAIDGVGNIPSLVWLKRLSPFRIVLVPDQDAAGEKLTNKLIDLFRQMHKEIYIKKLPAKDATEVVKEVMSEG